MEIVSPKPVGFLCGSIPVLADNSFAAFSSALVPSCETVSAPRYRMLPTETDLNRPPLLKKFPEKVLPLAAVKSRTAGDISWEPYAVSSNLSKKCEALAVSGLVEYGDEIDVIAPADILKQIFKIPYSKARVSIAVQRVGQTLVLNAGPDVEEGDKMFRRHNNQPKCSDDEDESLLLNFAMHSVRMEACDCPPAHRPHAEEQSSSSALPGGETCSSSPDDGFESPAGHDKQVKQDRFIWENKTSKKNKGREPVRRTSRINEKIKPSVESDKQRRAGSNEFLRVLFWQFHNFRMLLGSDLLLFSNEKYVAVSLHLWDVSRQVTPLTWLEAWLDNVMASVPELAICYHQDGVVQGYELLKTDDIFLLKGISEDGTPAFHPHVVQQNGLAVLRFLQANCKQDPGAYWLYKSAGEDVIQLFDLSIISRNHSSSNCNDSASPLPSLIHRGRNDPLFSLGNLLYRVGHRLSLSVVPNDRAKCARFLRKCLDFLDEPDHLVVRAYAHEQFARLILNDNEELDLSSESLNVECEVTLTDIEEESLTVDHENEMAIFPEDKFSEDYTSSYLSPSASVKMNLVENVSPCKELLRPGDPDSKDSESAVVNSSSGNSFGLCPVSRAPEPLVETVTSPISSKLAAIHHVSQAIKSLRWTRQLQHSEKEVLEKDDTFHDILSSSAKFSICECGDPDCIEVCDIRKWLPTSKLNRKLWNLVLLLGESYLSLGEAYKEDGQLHQTLKTVELACSIYGSMPHKFDETLFISSMSKSLSLQSKTGPCDLTLEQLSSTQLFWAKAWMLVGDVYVEFHIVKGKELSKRAEETSTNRLRMSSEVVKEVQRLKKKLTQYSQNCSSCSLVNCSCKSDRASSGSSASSSISGPRSISHGRKSSRKPHYKNPPGRVLRDFEDEQIHLKTEKGSYRESETSMGSLGIATSATTKDQSAEGSFGEKKAEPLEQNVMRSKETQRVKKGGIFKYLNIPKTEDAESNLLAALSCYEEARKALQELPMGCDELQSVIKKKGWVCNELGRNRLKSKELNKAEDAFADAVMAFKEVSDHTNVILINCNLGHGRRNLAEEMVSKLEALKFHDALTNPYRQALAIAKLEYSKSLRYYMAAKTELTVAAEKAGSVPDNLKIEALTQLGHTYLRLGMLLAEEDTPAEWPGHNISENTHVSSDIRARNTGKHEISANDAIREALSIYESLGEARKQEAAYAYLQLARYQKDRCLRFLELDHQKENPPKTESNSIQRAKQYAMLADRNWQKSMDFYGPKTHPSMFLTILIERAALSFDLSKFWQSNIMLDSALSRLLEGRHVSETISDSSIRDDSELHARFWGQIRMVLKRMLTLSLPAEANKTWRDNGKLREMYKMSLKATSLSDLNDMHSLWTSSS
ncbi:PREDICTED: uncharacterized protein LOC104806788 [Tarenaya hassleriana]|uniref:uncharacterized protein LOC104806788 n=1 Tax=Tarenaya hassleriana TaxID=28532 RepID=UPI00053C1177|nr:PREDICTED: uncharacterized protein LOC104806788 [Tarenaya hassleriana]